MLIGYMYKDEVVVELKPELKINIVKTV